MRPPLDIPAAAAAFGFGMLFACKIQVFKVKLHNIHKKSKVKPSARLKTIETSVDRSL